MFLELSLETRYRSYWLRSYMVMSRLLDLTMLVTDQLYPPLKTSRLAFWIICQSLMSLVGITEKIKVVDPQTHRLYRLCSPAEF